MSIFNFLRKAKEPAMDFIEMSMRIAPVVGEVVDKFEKIISEAGMGKVKKDMIISAYNRSVDVIRELDPDIDIDTFREPLEQVIDGLIEDAVAGYKAAGYWKQRKLDPSDFGKNVGKSSGSDSPGFARAGLLVSLCLGVFLVLACTGKLGTQVAYEGVMEGEGPTAVKTVEVCKAAQECMGGELETMPNLRILTAAEGEESDVVECRGSKTDGCYMPETRTVVLPIKVSDNTIIDMCIHDWLNVQTGDPDLDMSNPDWDRCQGTLRIE